MGGSGGSGSASFGRSGGGSGGGGGRGGGGGGKGGGGGDPCSAISEFVDLLSPKAAIVKKLKRGDTLTLKHDKATEAIQVVTSNDDVAGSVVPSDPDALIKCLKKGKTFKAHVVSVAGGACKLHITMEI